MKTTSDLLVEEFATPSPITLAANAKVSEAADAMKIHGIRHIPIIMDGRPVGIISERDLKVIANFEDFRKIKVQDLMTTQPYTVTSDTPIQEVALSMSTNKYGSALVTFIDDDSLGIFTVTDALNALIEIIRDNELN